MTPPVQYFTRNELLIVLGDALARHPDTLRHETRHGITKTIDERISTAQKLGRIGRHQTAMYTGQQVVGVLFHLACSPVASKLADAIRDRNLVAIEDLVDEMLHDGAELGGNLAPYLIPFDVVPPPEATTSLPVKAVDLTPTPSTSNDPPA